jgi:hypothetical protein
LKYIAKRVIMQILQELITEDATLCIQTIAMLFKCWRKAATSLFLMPVVRLSVIDCSACHFRKGYSDLTDLYCRGIEWMCRRGARSSGQWDR